MSNSNNNNQDAAKVFQFQALETLPLRFLIWCSPLNDDNNDAREQHEKQQPGRSGAGDGSSAAPAPKTEYIPLASLFRRAATGGAGGC
ncbi:hypothetical protein ACA910_002164 [Epithemia clementina (nom. ined.)]